jgi:FtsP/CotA-like multicopper oxidase with cupredoxin domain
MTECIMKITRRSFLKSACLAAAGFAITPGAVSRALGSTNRKIREFYFLASKSRVNLGIGPDFLAWTYNGQIPGPEIRVREGEIIRVVLKNELPEETSVHWHGLPVPNAMDGVPGVTQKGVQPGEDFVYEFEARPAGTFMYHSHAGYQLDQGLYGPLIIEPLREKQSHDKEFALLLEDWVMRDNGAVAPVRRRPPSGMGMMGGMMGRGMGMRRWGRGDQGTPLLEPVYDAYAVNGRVYPAGDPLVVKTGDRVKLRLLNPSSATTYYLSLAGHPLTITHADGNPVQPFETDVLRIGMGERYDVEFVADNPGYWLLAAMDRGFGEGQLRIPISYKGVQRKTPAGPVFHRGLRSAAHWDLKAFGPNQPFPGDVDRFISQNLSGGMHSPYWTINGQVYPDAPSPRVRQGDHVRIGYWNRSMMPHPMHLHGHFFRVVNPYLPPEQWIMKDTVIVDPMQRLEIDFVADNPGKWFHHCHNLYHMMAGMANVVAYEL